MGTIVISVEEYKKLIEMEVRVNIFKDYVNGEKYSISRETCASMLGFELEEREERKVEGI